MEVLLPVLELGDAVPRRRRRLGRQPLGHGLREAGPWLWTLGTRSKVRDVQDLSAATR